MLHGDSYKNTIKLYNNHHLSYPGLQCGFRVPTWKTHVLCMKEGYTKNQVLYMLRSLFKGGSYQPHSTSLYPMMFITIFKSITVFCGTGSFLWNILQNIVNPVEHCSRFE